MIGRPPPDLVGLGYRLDGGALRSADGLLVFAGDDAVGQARRYEAARAERLAHRMGRPPARPVAPGRRRPQVGELTQLILDF